MELLYRVWRDDSEAAGRLALEQCLALPIEWVHESPELLTKAAEIKALYPLPPADAWIAASAALAQATLVHKDPEFSALPLAQELLPLKPLKAAKTRPVPDARMRRIAEAEESSTSAAVRSHRPARLSDP